MFSGGLDKEHGAVMGLKLDGDLLSSRFGIWS